MSSDHLHTLGAGHSHSRFTAAFCTNGIASEKLTAHHRNTRQVWFCLGFYLPPAELNRRHQGITSSLQTPCAEAAWADEPALHRGFPCPRLPISSRISRRVGHSPSGNPALAPAHGCRQTSKPGMLAALLPDPRSTWARHCGAWGQQPAAASQQGSSLLRQAADVKMGITLPIKSDLASQLLWKT